MKTWVKGQTFSAIVLKLADKARSTGYWHGSESWKFTSAINAIVNALIVGLD